MLTNLTTLDVGVYHLNVSAFDAQGQYNSTTFNVNVTDTIMPFVAAPANATLEYSFDSLSESFTATDPSGTYYRVDDDVNFNITQGGVLTNKTTLAVGTYNLNISVNDTYNNLNWTMYKVTVSDTTPPTLDCSLPYGPNVEFITPPSHQLPTLVHSTHNKWNIRKLAARFDGFISLCALSNKMGSVNSELILV